MSNKMDKKTEELYYAARNAKIALTAGKIEYDAALVIVKRYTDHADIKAVAIAKRFGMKPRKIDPKGFLR